MSETRTRRRKMLLRLRVTGRTRFLSPTSPTPRLLGCLRDAEVRRGRQDGGDRRRRRRQARGRRKARGPEGHRPQHPVRAEVGRGRWAGRRRSLPTVAARQCRSRRRGRCGHRQDPAGTPPQRAADELEDSIAPGHSGIVALVSDPAAVKVQEALDKAERIVASAIDDAATEEIKAAAKRDATEV